MADPFYNNKLAGEYEIAYQDILGYLQGSNISPDSKFSVEVQEDMKDMLLSAQENQLPVSNIIGKDIKSFCENIAESHNTKKVKLLRLLKDLNFSLVYLALITLLFQIFDGSFNLNIVIIVFLCWFLYKYILNFFYKKIGLNFKGWKNKIKCLVLIFLVSLLGLFPLVLLIIKYFNVPINGYYAAAICVLLVLPIHIVCRKLDKGIKWYSYLR